MVRALAFALGISVGLILIGSGCFDDSCTGHCDRAFTDCLNHDSDRALCSQKHGDCMRSCNAT